jgi:mono/diheme cytochrome c family protein
MIPFLLTLGLDLACTCRPPSPFAHFDNVDALRSATQRGEIEAALEEARRLDGGVRMLLGGDAVDAFDMSVGFLLASVDVEDLGEGLAAVGRACGDCHRARGPKGAPPSDPPLSHAQAEDRLWTSLGSGHSESAREAVLFLRERAPTEALRDEALQVGSTCSQEEIESLYGRLVASCGACHASEASFPRSEPARGEARPSREARKGI